MTQKPVKSLDLSWETHCVQGFGNIELKDLLHCSSSWMLFHPPPHHNIHVDHGESRHGLSLGNGKSWAGDSVWGTLPVFECCQVAIPPVFNVQ